jgi:regulatory protein
MKEITAMKAQKRNRDRVNVYLDGKFAFGLALEAAAGLKIGQRLSLTEIAELQDRDQFAQAKDKALRYLTYRPRSESEVWRNLQRKGYEDDVIKGVIHYLKERQLLDDAAFAAYWVEQRETFKPRSRLALSQELREKGIARQVIEAAVADVDEVAAAERAGEKRARRWRQLPYEEFRKKMGGYLQRRGFRYDVTKATIDKIWEKYGSEQSTSERR